ncbi:MAG TPA: tetratricopeptide repeat protein [Candidatus Omnitrophota bacterium]|nr:tetratricopeptide repeat protein [Candidatus Omnitrophota bacterium]
MKPEELFKQALLHFKNGQTEEACKKLSHTIEIDSKFEDGYEALAVILINQDKISEAVQIIAEWLKINPNAVMAYTNLSRCLMRQGKIPEAEEAQAKAATLGWRQAAGLKPQSEPTAVDNLEKIERFKKVIELDPADVLGYFSLGNAYLDAYKKDLARQTFEKAVQVDPEHSSSYYGLGQAWEALGNKEKATEIYKQGITVADKKGDMMTQRKMEARLRTLKA